MRPADRAAVHVAVEHAHEDRDAHHRAVAERELGRRHGIGDPAHPPVGGRDHETFAQRGHPRRIAEEIDAPQRGESAEPAERRPQPHQEQACDREPRDEGIAFVVDRNELRADRGDDRHAHSAASAATISRASSGGRPVVETRRRPIGRCIVLAHKRQRLARLFRLALPVPHAGIEPAGRQQACVRAALDDDALVEHQDLVGGDHGRQAVGDDEGGAVRRDRGRARPGCPSRCGCRAPRSPRRAPGSAGL